MRSLYLMSSNEIKTTEEITKVVCEEKYNDGDKIVENNRYKETGECDRQ